VMQNLSEKRAVNGEKPEDIIQDLLDQGHLPFDKAAAKYTWDANALLCCQPDDVVLGGYAEGEVNS
jgi:hypothetical protein